jgi:4-diphosphocytidyl-2C-methyl-D-erythritol kinase
MIFLAHFTLENLTKINIIIWIAKTKAKTYHELLTKNNKGYMQS